MVMQAYLVRKSSDGKMVNFGSENRQSRETGRSKGTPLELLRSWLIGLQQRRFEAITVSLCMVRDQQGHRIGPSTCICVHKFRLGTVIHSHALTAKPLIREFGRD
jgi:hypothetical protein